MTDVARQQRLTEAQSEAQTILTLVSEDVRRCESIVSVSSGTLVLRTFDTRLPYDTASIFNASTFGTISYQYDETGGEANLIRTEQYPNRSTQKRFLRKSLAKPTVSAPLFSPYPSSASSPYSAVSAVINLSLPFNVPVSSYSVTMTTRRSIQ